jgi:GAF domain-containing protein
MISQGRVIGVIEVVNKINGNFDTNDRDLLQAIAASVCIALENARLYKETVAAAEHERDVRRIFQKFVPKHVIDTILHAGGGRAARGRGVEDHHPDECRHPRLFRTLPGGSVPAKRCSC